MVTGAKYLSQVLPEGSESMSLGRVERTQVMTEFVCFNTEAGHPGQA